MSSKQKRGFRDSIDDVLGDLLGEDDDSPTKPGYTAPRAGSGPGRPARPPRTGKRSLLDDDFFSNLAQEADQDNEESEVSEADPQALLDSMKDIEDMDADLFSKGKKASPSPSQTAVTASSKPPSPQSRAAKDVPGQDEKPVASSGRPYKKFTFNDMDDPLAGILSDEESEPNKPAIPGKQRSVRSAELDVTKKEEKVSSSPASAPPTSTPHRKEELTFDDGDDLMDALGFGDGLKANKEMAKRGEEEGLRPARSKLDELLGRGTASKLLERPPTAEQKEFKLDPKYKKTQEEKEELLDDFTFGSYQPTVATTPEGRQSRRQSVRFSPVDEGDSFPDQKLKSSAPSPPTPTRLRSSKSAGDWLGLKDEEPLDLGPQRGTPLNRAESDPALPAPAAPSQPPHTDRPVSAAKPSVELQRGSTPSTPSAPGGREADWLAGALARKKAQAGDSSLAGLGDGARVQPSSRARASLGVRGRPPAEAPSEAASERRPGEARDTDSSSFPWEPPHGQPTALPATDTRAGVKASETLSLQNQLRIMEAEQQMSLQRAEATIVELQSQVRKLELEREQQGVLMESLQQRHEEDSQLLEDAHRKRLKVLEELWQGREARLQEENQELANRHVTRQHSLDQERSQLIAQHQRRLTESDQEKAREMERIRELQRQSIVEMRRDHEEQLERVRLLKEQEIDAVTSATSHTRSLNGVIEQMEAFSRKMNDLSCKVESTHHNTSQEIEFNSRQREAQHRAQQERLQAQQRDLEEERVRLQEVITKMEIRLNEQTRLLEKERWRAVAEQTKVESVQRSLAEERRIMSQHFAIEREELERAKNALLEEQQSVMQRCAEERRKLASEWAEYHTQHKLRQERVEQDSRRALQLSAQQEGAIFGLAKEQAEMKLKASEIKSKEEQLAREREAVESERRELEKEKERVNDMAVRIRQKAEEIEGMSKIASQKYEEGERALLQAKQVEGEHQTRLQAIQQKMERLQQQEEQLLQQRLNLTQHQRRPGPAGIDTRIPSASLGPAGSAQPLASLPYFTPGLGNNLFGMPGNSREDGSLQPVVGAGPSELEAKLALFKHTAAKDQDFLEDEQLFLATLKQAPYNTPSQLA
ncbi:fas-binding factor 1 homolog [Callorhinchus milii]|uniref:fas-binding factor 1 homolog n=1 Tax=Callorhinchus milii TaxID=7868 RepID=UPI001C3FC175|nr:fas-binding factor 1 homolog [Callorhinchus milii]